MGYCKHAGSRPQTFCTYPQAKTSRQPKSRRAFYGTRNRRLAAPQGIQSIINGSYTPRHLKRYYFQDEMVDQLHLSDRILQHILLKQLKPTFPYVMNPNCYHLQGPSGVRVATQRIRQILAEQNPQYIIRADIKSFYKSIPHFKLIQDIKTHYQDPNLHAMLEQIIINPIETPRGYKNPDHGIALRGPLSQFFSGLYLKPLDDLFNTMDVAYIRYQDDLLIFCQTKRQFDRCKQRMMGVLKERQLRLSSKKTRMGHIKQGFHFLGVQYPGTQTLDNTNVPQVNDGAIAPVNIAHYLTSLGGGRQMLQRTIKHLRWKISSRIPGRYEKHANKLSTWLC